MRKEIIILVNILIIKFKLMYNVEMLMRKYV